MNRIYRVIFNLAVGAWQVVSELVSAPRGLARGGTGGAVVGTVPPLRFALWCAFGMVTISSPLMAQEAQGRILVDRAAPGDQRPMVVEAPSGAPLINITTPSAAGVSRNNYSQLDVDTQGAILNNSRTGAQTELGGAVQGNPFLATGTAKVILNEVNGPASQLNGYVEVAGDRAAVVIANPAGIQANGAGFINASRVTLTTGMPVFNGGSLDGYRVGSGAIRVDGAGLDTTRADYTDLIARSLELNGKVWAQQLQATLGANTVGVDALSSTPRGVSSTQTGDGIAPQFALDASALGGMYANKITLLGTEQGVGVRNAGTIGAQAGELIVTVNGRLENTGKLQAQTNTRIETTGGVANAGTVSAGREAVITSGADVDNSGGMLNAQRIEVNAAALANRGGTIEQTGVQGLALNAQAVSNRDGGRIGLTEPTTGGGSGTGGGGTTGGGDSGGSTGGSEGGEVVLPPPEVLADGVLNIAGALNNDGGKINAGGGVQLNTTTGIDNSGGHLGLGQLAINQGDLLNNGGELTVTGDARVHADRIGNDAGRFEVGGALDLDAQTISNRAGTISHSGTTDARIHAGTFDNTDGTLATNANALNVSGDVMVNERGRIEHAGAGGLTIGVGTLRGADGAIVTNGAAALSVGNVDHRGATLSATQVTLTANNFDNRGGDIVATSTNANTLTVSGTLDNGDSGTISSNGDLSITAATLGNAGGTVQQAGAGTLAIDAVTLEGTGGRLASNGALAITGNTTNLRDGTTVTQRVAIDTGTLTTAGGTLTAAGTDPLTITARNGLDNTAGTIATNGVAQLNAGSLTNTDGTLSAAGTGASTVTVGTALDNTRGTIATGGALGIQAGTVINRDTRAADGETASTGIQVTALTVNAGSVDNANGQMTAADTLALTASALDNTAGSITAANALTLDTATLNGAGGTVGTNGALNLKGNTLDLSGGTTFAESIHVDAGTLRTVGGMLSATGTNALQITARDAVDNAGGTIATNGALDLTVGSATIDTCDGKVLIAGDGCGVLNNAGGTISAAGTHASTINASGAIDNTGGLIAGSGALTINTATLANRDTLSADPDAGTKGVLANDLSVDARHLDNAHGQIAANKAATLTARALDNTAGTITAVNALTVNATTLNGGGGTLGANGALTLTGDVINLRGGTTSAKTITVDAGDLTTAGGTLVATGPEALQLNVRRHLDNSAGTIATNGAIQLDAGSVNNTDGALQAASTGPTDLRIAGTFDNTRGTLATAGATTIHSGDLINAAGLIQAASDSALTLEANGHLDNTGGTVVANGAIDLKAQSLTNAGGMVQTQQGLTANVVDTLDNSGGLMVASGDLTATAGTLLNRNTLVANATAPTGMFGRRVTLSADTLDNTRGQVVANDALTVRGNTQAGSALTNAGGVLDGAGTTTVTATSFENTGGQLVQRGAGGTLAVDVSGALVNANGLVGAEGTGNVHADSIDNGAGTVFAQHGLTVASEGDLRNTGGAIRTGQADDPATDADENIIANLDVRAVGALDNTDGVIDATGVAGLTAARIDNVRGQVLSGATETDTLTLNTAALNNQGGVIGTRAGDAVLNVADVDNRNGGRLVADRDLTLNSTRVDNSSGTAFTNRNLSFENAAGTLTNAGGLFGAGDTALLTLANVSNTNNGLIQAGNVWLNTPNLDLSGTGKVIGNEVHAQLTTLTGDGSLYGTQWLDADFSGDYTYGTGPTLASDTLLDLAVAGTFTNVGALQTPGELALSATSVINQGAINASNADGSGYAHITAGSIENRRGASLEGDWLELNANVVNNTGDIVGDNVTITADTLTNGQALGTALAAVNYGEGFIGASQYLDIRANHVANLDGDVFSGGDLYIGGRDAARAVDVANISGRIQAEGNAWISADTIRNERRMLAVETYTLSADEAYALGSTKAFDELYAALSPTDRADYDRIMATYNKTAADKLRLAELLPKVGWVRVSQLSEKMYTAADAELNRIAIAEYGATSSWMIENPSALEYQNDTYQTGQRLDAARTSAESQIITGGDLTLDSGGLVRNVASRIAAGGNLTIAGNAFDPNSSNPNVENIAVAGEYTGQRATTAWIFEPPVNTKYTDGRGTHQTVAEFAVTVNEGLTTTGPNLADATITAGKGVFIDAGDVTNTAVTAGSGMGALSGGGLNGAGSTALGSTNRATAGSAGDVTTANGNTVEGQTGPRSAQGGTTGTRVGPSGAVAQFIGTADSPLPGLVADDNGMFDVNADPSAKFLVTTAPRFTKGGPWDSSDYLLNALRTDPNNIHKRLGDGYYEQRLVMEQIFQLTGRRSLNGDGDANAQYRALMQNAAATADRLGLQLGAPLTSAQIGALDSDIVWLVEQEVNGQKVLVPVVYLSKATAERMAAEGALIDGDTLSINAAGTLHNDGTLSANKGAFLSADTLINDGKINGGAFTGITTRGDTINTGRIEGNAIAIDAGGSVINGARFDGLNATAGVINAGTGGLQIDAKVDVINQGQMASAGHAVVTAGRDFVQNAATTQIGGGTIKAPAGSLTTGGSAVITTGRDVVLDQGSITTGQHTVIDAGRDAHFTASTVDAGGSIAVTAGRDIIADTVTDTRTTYDSETVKNGKKKTTTTTITTDETLRGSTFQAGGDIAMVAGQDINLTAATVHSGKGDIALAAGRDVSLLSGYETDKVVQDSSSKKQNTLSSTKTTSHTEISDTTAVGTTLSGENVSVSAKRDITTEGATVVATHDVAMAAGRNLTIGTAQNTYTESGTSSSRKSGISGAGAGITIGTSKTNQDYSVTQTTHEGSLIGALNGSVSLSAGEAVHITGSDVLSNKGTAITGKAVAIDAAVDTTQTTQSQKTRSAGIHIGLKGGAATAAEQAYSYGKAADEVSDDRLKALYALEAANNAMAAADGVNAIANGASPSSGGMALRIGIGASSASAQMESYDETARGSNIRSNGNVLITATDGDLNVIGSNVEGKNVGLAATGNINLKSQEEQHSFSSQNKNGSAEVGVSIGKSTGFYVSADAGRGNGQRNGTTHAETTIKASDTAVFVSGGDTTLQGAQMIGDRVIGQVSGNLNVISEQDTDNVRNKQQQAGGEFVYGAGGSAYYNQQNIDSRYASVKEQSGIQAGSGGFQIDVQGNTHLQGGAIASTADPGQNRLSTGSLTIEDIKNEAKYTARTMGAGTDGSGLGQAAVGAGLSALGSQKDGTSSVTRSDIAPGTIEVRNGDTTALAGLDRTTTSLGANGIDPIFDQRKVEERFALGQEAAKIGFQVAGNIASGMENKARTDLANATTEEEKRAAQARIDAWSDGGANKVLLHGVTGAAAALGGGDAMQGALGAGGAEAAKGAMSNYLAANNVQVGSDLYNTLMELGSAALGGVLGGTTGAGTALAGDQFNRQLHSDEIAWINANASEFALSEGISVDEAKRRLIVAAAGQVDATINQRLNEKDNGYDADALDFLSDNRPTFAWGQGFTEQDAGKYLDFNYNAGGLTQNLGDFQQVYNALAQSGLSPIGLQSLYHDQLLAWGERQANNGGTVVGQFMGVTGGAGATLALAGLALEACAVNPAGCNAAVTGVIETMGGEALGGYAVAPVVAGGAAAAHMADEIGDAARVASKVEDFASSASTAPKLNSQLIAEEVASGHAYTKHVVEGQEFAELGISTKEEFAAFIRRIVDNPSTSKRYAADGTTYYLDEATHTIVIRGQRGEPTAFRPDYGIGWDTYLKSQVPKNANPPGRDVVPNGRY
ncbi:MAG TPA: hemagglutinin repeat-containing protein [Lysobacter sp.]